MSPPPPLLSAAASSDQRTRRRRFCERLTTACGGALRRSADSFARLPSPQCRRQRRIVAAATEPMRQPPGTLLPPPLLLQCDNRPLAKTLLALWCVCREARRVCDEADDWLLPALLVYGEPPCEHESPAAQIARVSHMLPVIDRLAAWHERVCSVVTHACRQMSLLYAGWPADRCFHVHVVFESVADALAAVQQVDLALRSQDTFKRHWIDYRDAMRRQAASRQSADAQNLAALIERLRRRVLSNSLFALALKHWEVLRCEGHATAALTDAMRVSVGEMIRCLQASKTPEGRDIMAAACLFVLHAHLTGGKTIDSQQLTALWQLHRQWPGVVLWCGGVVWRLDECLTEYVGGPAKQRTQRQSFGELCAAWIERTAPTAARQADETRQRLARWCVQVSQLCTIAGGSNTCSDSHAAFTSLLLDGAAQMTQLTSLCRRLLELHAVCARSLSPTMAVCLCRHVETLKAVEQCVDALDMRQAAAAGVRQMGARLVQLVEAAQSRLIVLQQQQQRQQRRRRRSSSSERLVDLTTAVQLAREAANTVTYASAVCDDRLLMLRVVLSACTQSNVLNATDAAEAATLLRCLRALITPAQFVRSLTDCRFMYWHYAAVAPELQELQMRPDLAAVRLPLLMAVLSDAGSLLALNPSAGSVASSSTSMASTATVAKYDRQAVATLERYLIWPLCAHVETALRLDIHADMPLDERPRPLIDRLRVMRPLLACALPVKLSTCAVSVSVSVERRLSRMFYQLAAVAAHDVAKYEHMRLLATHKYGLRCLRANLPPHVLDQGADLISLARRLDRLVGTHTYDMFQQTFRASTATRELSGPRHQSDQGAMALAATAAGVVLSPQHVTNSLRTHGLGVADTVANAIYQLVRQLVAAVSRLAADERLQARLAREASALTDQNGEFHFSFDSAERLKRGAAAVIGQPVRKTSSVGGGGGLRVMLSLLARLGTAVALARLLDTGRRRCTAESLQFSRDYSPVARQLAVRQSGHCDVDLPCYQRLCEDAAMSQEVIESASAVDRCLTDLAGRCIFIDRTDSGRAGDITEDDDTLSCAENSNCSDYLALLTATLAPALREHEHAHLRNFYLLLPPLLLTQAECSSSVVTAGGRMTSAFGDVPLDDAAVLGAVFMLTVLDQVPALKSLGWPELVQRYYERRLADAATDRRSGEIPAARHDPAGRLTRQRLQRELRRQMYLNQVVTTAALILRPDSA